MLVGNTARQLLQMREGFLVVVLRAGAVTEAAIKRTGDESLVGGGLVVVFFRSYRLALVSLF